SPQCVAGGFGRQRTSLDRRLPYDWASVRDRSILVATWPFFGQGAVPMSATSKRVVIVGGGFAGVSAAQELTRRLKRERRLSRPDAPRPDGVEVLLLNRDNYFVF